jgi:nucleoside-diphosphate-sugar epimerase
MNVLVVGGAGYLGGAVVDLLLQSQHRTRVYDVLLYEESYRKPVDFSYGDVRDAERLRGELSWADAVVWLTAVVGDRACDLNRDTTIAINEKSVAWLARNFDGRILFTSTCSVYGEQKHATLTETSPLNPLSLYASTKISAEKHLAQKNAIVFRLGTMFGVGDSFSRLRLDLVVNTFTVQAFHRGTISIIGGEQFRPLLHVRDAARAIVDNIAAPNTGIFNLHRQNVRIGDLASQVRNHFPDLVIESVAMPARDARDYRVNSDKARSLLGFAPSFSIDDGIEDLKNILRANRLKQIDNPRYANDRFLASIKNFADSPNQVVTLVEPGRSNGRSRQLVPTEFSAEQKEPVAAA